MMKQEPTTTTARMDLSQSIKGKLTELRMPVAVLVAAGR